MWFCILLENKKLESQGTGPAENKHAVFGRSPLARSLSHSAAHDQTPNKQTETEGRTHRAGRWESAAKLRCFLFHIPHVVFL